MATRGGPTNFGLYSDGGLIAGNNTYFNLGTFETGGGPKPVTITLELRVVVDQVANIQNIFP